MLFCFLLLVIKSVAGFSGADHVAFCSSAACLTLHTELVGFERARLSCEHRGGGLMTVRRRDEEDLLLALLSHIQKPLQDRPLAFWIGLKRHRGDCVFAEETLRGFKWISGEGDSHYSNWEKEPVSTCTEERCVKVHLMSLSQTQLRWSAGACGRPAFYICRFDFKRMCAALTLLGPGTVTYATPFSPQPQRREMQFLPPQTRATVICRDQRSFSSVCGDDGFRWTLSGPFCTTEKRKCAINKGECEHACVQEEDGVRCLCGEGYRLDQDGLSCRRENSCGLQNCEHECVLGDSGYACTCPDGFNLDTNKQNCSDIDECQSYVCEDFCINTYGSYMCVCKNGHEMFEGRCRDTDECATSSCEHHCLNSIGSFSCSCNTGFTLHKDGRSCVDEDECSRNLCEHGCINTAGSFVCSCRQGFRVKEDGRMCEPDEAETSAASLDVPAGEKTPENFADSSRRAEDELQHRPDNHTLSAGAVNVTHANLRRSTDNARLVIIVLGSVLPLLLLLAVTVAVLTYRCNRSQKEARKKSSTEGYCWVSSALDPRLEKLYESILTDDL